MNRVSRLLLLSPIVAATAMFSPRDAKANPWSECNGGSYYNDVCYEGYTDIGNIVFYGVSENASAFYGIDSAGGNGVYGQSDYGAGVSAFSTSNDAVYATSGQNTINTAVGVFYSSGTGTYALGVEAEVAGDGTGLYASSQGGKGVYGINQGDNSGGVGVWGVDTSSGTGGGYGMYTTSTNGVGVYASGSTFGVEATASGTDSTGMYATCTGTGCWAAQFGGNANILLGYSIKYDGIGGETCIGGACSSDRRLKHNIEPLGGAMDKLLALKGLRTGDYRVLPGGACPQRRAALQPDGGAVAAMLNPPCNLIVAKEGYKSFGRVIDLIGPSARLVYAVPVAAERSLTHHLEIIAALEEGQRDRASVLVRDHAAIAHRFAAEQSISQAL